MPWVRFTSDFDFKPKPGVTLAYLRGDVLNVPRAASAAALCAGKAVAMKKTHRHSEPVEILDHDS